MTIPRDVQIARSAAVRSLIMAKISNAEAPLTRQDILDGEVQDKLTELGMPLKTFENILYRLTVQNMVSASADEDKVKRFSARTQLITREKPNTQPRKDSPSVRKPQVTQPISIDLVKSSGRIRITYKECVIEVGIVD